MANLADSLAHLDRGAEAISIIDECIRLSGGATVDPRLMSFVMSLRLRHFAKIKDEAGCRQTAVMLEALKRTDANYLYDAACFRSVTSAVIRAGDKSPAGSKQSETEADQGMAWLKQAVAAGYNDPNHMEKDKDLDALRSRDDFKKLLAELKAGSGTKK
jgi:hypothetical protein